MKIGILFDGGGRDWDQKDVAAVMTNVSDIQGCLRRAGHEVSQHPVQLGDVSWLRLGCAQPGCLSSTMMRDASP